MWQVTPKALNLLPQATRRRPLTLRFIHRRKEGEQGEEGEQCPRVMSHCVPGPHLHLTGLGKWFELIEDRRWCGGEQVKQSLLTRGTKEGIQVRQEPFPPLTLHPLFLDPPFPTCPPLAPPSKRDYWRGESPQVIILPQENFPPLSLFLFSIFSFLFSPFAFPYLYSMIFSLSFSPLIALDNLSFLLFLIYFFHSYLSLFVLFFLSLINGRVYPPRL